MTTRDGVAIPIVGFGTWQLTGGFATEAVLAALESGYRHLDTATVYGNEREIGRSIAASGVSREQLFITTKLPGNATSVRATLEESLEHLETDYVDLWLIHWPPSLSYEPSDNSSARLFEQMLELRDEGLVRAVGVSNYDLEAIDELTEAAGEAPAVNQISWGPFAWDASLQAQLERRGVVLEGYSPLQSSRLDHPALEEIARSVAATPAQVVLRWHLEHRVIVLPRSSNAHRIRENLDVFGFGLDADALRRLDELGRSSTP